MSPSSNPSRLDEIRAIANLIAEAQDADVFLYNASITRDDWKKFSQLISSRRKRKIVLFVLVTEGGDGGAAYRIARCMQRNYEKFVCIISGYCKSAGTLVATGAQELVISDDGELGPIDIQLPKKDELWEFQSGLTASSALTTLQEKSYLAFQHFLLTTKRGGAGSITLKTAADIATKLTVGLFSPIYGSMDPIYLGEAARAMTIASNYCRRLDHYSKNLKAAESLEYLVAHYPDHRFVIDREEASSLFKKVRQPNANELSLIELLGDWALVPQEDGIIDCLCDEPAEVEDNAGNDQIGRSQEVEQGPPGQASSPPRTNPT